MKIAEKRLLQALTGKGVKGLSSNNVESIFECASDKPYILGRVEAKRIEPQFDRDMPNYSIYGSLPSAGKGIEFDKSQMIALFRKFNDIAQANETYAIRYDVWFSALEVE